jgi:hypothetical protein
MFKGCGSFSLSPEHANTVGSQQTAKSMYNTPYPETWDGEPGREPSEDSRIGGNVQRCPRFDWLLSGEGVLFPGLPVQVPPAR